MSDSNNLSCPSCGSKLALDAETCDLCGESLTSEGKNDRPQGAESGAASTARVAGRIYCTECGAEQADTAKFCNQCGSPLEGTPAVPPGTRPAAQAEASKRTSASAEGEAPPQMSRRIATVVGGAVLLVIGFFVITSLSQDAGYSSQPVASEEAATAEASGPQGEIESLIAAHEEDELPPQIAEQAQEIQSELEGLEQEQRWAKQAELVNLYIGAGRTDRAAIEQRRIAQASGATSAWERAGSLLHDWMMTTEDQSRMLIAELTVDAYERVLEVNPADHDARTNLATAYLETNNPMRGVEEIQRVLEEKPDHIQARFNYGIMLAMIGRAQESIEQFERVKEFAGPDSPHSQEADQIIREIQAQLEVQEDS